MVEGEPGSAFEDEVVIRRVRFTAPDGAFAVLEADRDGDEVVLVGPVAHLEERERVAVSGTWQDDKRFGMQVRVARAEPLPPSGDEALLAYLRRVKHVGDTRAARLLDRHGPRVLDAIDEDPRAAFKRAGLSARQAGEAAKAWDALRSQRALHLLLAPHGLAWLVPRIDKHYGGRAHRVVKEEPYELTTVFGVGFTTADRIARAAGVPAASPARTAAALLHVLAEAERDGSTCLPVAEAARKAAQLTAGDPPDAPLMTELVAQQRLTIEVDRDRQAWAYRPPTARLEAELATRVRELAGAPPSRRLRAPDAPPPDEREMTPAPAQWEAVTNAFAHRLSIVTGGPGTGKTATIRMLCAAAHAQDARTLLVAPTGRAARRVAESTGLEASTVHSTLQWIPGEGPVRDETNPLEGDLLVVDETSMANLELLVSLLRAVGPRMHVVLVGDADQLAPVGAGKPFAELVGSGLVPTAALTHIFRQAAGSLIVRAAHEVRAGRPPTFEAPENTRRDLFMIERPDPAQALEEIVSLVATRLPQHYDLDPVEDVQVFAPVYKGPLGIDALNLRLREALNPGGERVLGGRLRIGDKLMLSGRNLHDLGLMNGTVLRLLAVSDDALTVSADGLVVDLPDEEAPRLQLAYACSVHKGQGIELPAAVLVAHPAAGAFFLRREMLYTAMTRARTATVIVGRSDVVAQAAARADTAGRHSRLVARLLG
ncbi:MAG TPA: AAA family ATPase [Solirubrobacteraceae bacterium]|nr:AAA family ATPase [Solirubrobacteraceae bacterium]